MSRPAASARGAAGSPSALPVPGARPGTGKALLRGDITPRRAIPYTRAIGDRIRTGTAPRRRIAPAEPRGNDQRRSHRADHPDDLPPQPDVPSAVGITSQPVQFPVTVLRVIGEDLAGLLPGGTSREVQIKVGVLDHSD